MRRKSWLSRNLLPVALIVFALGQMVGTLRDGLVVLALVDAGIIGALVMGIILVERLGHD